MGRNISPLASVDPKAELADDVTIGPFCVIGPHVRIGAGTHLLGNVTVMGHVVIGEHNVIYPNAVIGGPPQDLSYKGEPTRVEIGQHNQFREGVTINRATTKECGVTRVGNHIYLMANSHVAHDCQILDHVIMANGVLLGGHAYIQERAIISGGAAVHHYTTVGTGCFIGGLSRIVHDVPPFMLVEGHPSIVRCVNLVGLKRQGLTSEEIASLGEAHRLIYRAKMGLKHAEGILASHNHLTPHTKLLLEFIARQHTGKHGRQREGARRMSADDTKEAA